MPFDGLTIRALTKELNHKLVGSRIDKIYQPEKDELSINIRPAKSKSLRLLISANARWARLHINTTKPTNPSKPPTFCMVLRKYLEGGRIVKVEQIGFDRIIHIHIEALDDFRELKTKVLICEFMGRHSNIILINPEKMIIIDAIKKYGNETSSYREILPGYEYIEPPAQDKLNIFNTDVAEFADYMWRQGNTSIKSALYKSLTGISPFSAEQICVLAGINPDMLVEEAGEYEFTTIFNYVMNLLETIDNSEVIGNIIFKSQTPLELAPYPLQHLPHTKLLQVASMNETCNLFYKTKLNLVKLENKKTNLNRRIKNLLDKAYKKQFHLESDLARAEDSDIYRIKGEIITANLYKLKKGDIKVKLENYYTGNIMEIELDPRYTPNQNAQRFFKNYNKSRNALIYLKKLLNANLREIDYLESILIAVNETNNLDDLGEITDELQKEGYLKSKSPPPKSSIKSRPRKFVSSDGWEILVGKNNRQNDWLTLKLANKNDLWLHTQKIPGTHVIIRLPVDLKSDIKIPTNTLEEAAGLAAYYSKAQNSTKVPVDYTFRSNVRKPKGAKPGMVIYDKFKTILVEPQSPNILELVGSVEDA